MLDDGQFVSVSQTANMLESHNENDHFYITLSSDASMDVHANNRISSFTNRLREPVHLHNNWEVALAEVHMPAVINNLTGACVIICITPQDPQEEAMGQQILYDEREALEIPFYVTPDPIQNLPHIDPWKGEWSHKTINNRINKRYDIVNIPNGLFFDTKELLLHINKYVRASPLLRYREYVEESRPTARYPVTFVHWPAENKAIIYVRDQDLIVYINEPLIRLLGFQNNPERIINDYEKEKQQVLSSKKSNKWKLFAGIFGSGDPLDTVYISLNVINLNCNIPPLAYIYSDIIAWQHVGDVHAPLLRTVPIKNYLSNEGTISLIFADQHFGHLTTRTFHTIAINICTPTGEPVPFHRGSGVTVVKLHFRRRFHNERN